MMLRKIILVLLCVAVGIFPRSHLSMDQKVPGEKINPTYRFEYTFKGEATGVILLFFRYRFYFYATASVLLTSEKIDKTTTRFHFSDIGGTGYLFRTWGFSGKILYTGAADYDPAKAQQLLDKDFVLFKETAPGYWRYIKTRNVFPFQILSRGEKVLTFKRGIKGNHWNCSLDMKLKPVERDKKVNFYFKPYHLLLEMVKIYNHSYLPGDFRTFSQLEPGSEWLSQPLDFSAEMNRIGRLATDIVEKYVTFKQSQTFRLAYRVISRDMGVLTIQGQAVPRVKIWNGYKIEKVMRIIKIRLADEVVLEDRVQVEILNKKGKGGTARCALTLLP